jgi:hypothetical protein
MDAEKMADPKPMNPMDRIHQRMDDILSELGDLKADVATVKADTVQIKSGFATCQSNCRDAISKHEHAIYGNGKDGLDKRLTIVEGKSAATDGGKTDTLSIKGMILLLGAVGTLIGAVAGAIGGTIGALGK